MADGYTRVEGWGPEIQPGTTTVVTVEDREAAQAAADAAATSATTAASSASAAASSAAAAADAAENISAAVAGQPDGLAQLDGTGKLVGSQVPSWLTQSALDTKYQPAGMSIRNVNADNTRRWRAGIGRALTGGYLNEVWIGDSIMGGCNTLNPSPTFDRPNSVPRKYGHLLSDLIGAPRAGGGIIRYQDGTYRDPRVATTGSANASCVGLANTQTATITADEAGDTFTLVYYDNWGAGVNGVKISINGATSGANFKTVVGAGAADAKWLSVTMTGVTIAVGNTIVVTSLGPTAYIAYAEVYKASGGIRSHNIAQAGTHSGSWVSTGTGFDPVRAIKDAPYFTPDVVHVGFGLFDAGVGGGWNGASMAGALTTLRGFFPNSDFVIHAMPVPGMYRDSPNTWLAFVDAQRALSDTLGVPLIDLQEILGGYTVENDLGLAGDDTAHLKQSAYAMWARSALRAIN